MAGGCDDGLSVAGRQGLDDLRRLPSASESGQTQRPGLRGGRGAKRPNNASVAITVKGRCRVHDDNQTKQWFFDKVTRRAFPDNEAARQGMIKMLDSPTRVVLCVTPAASFSYDGTKMFHAASGGQPNS